MTKDLKGDRWTCPNDRNLQLRSKLNAGWSIHTGKKTVKKDPQLTEAELIEIQKVLQRSELLERNERDRVIKLVDRLENMKRNAIQAGCNLSSNRCALCGDYFCLLRTAPTQCNSCNMILCNKCCIDTEYTIDNDLSSNQSHSRRNSSSNVSISNNLIGSTSSNSKTVYLCRICSEQREFLKKSGAWFLKKFPNYLTNGLNTKSTSTSNVSQIERTSISPTEKKHNYFISPQILKRNISAISSNSSSFPTWKLKEAGIKSGFDITDNLSVYSIENDRNEASNCECKSVKSQAESKDNLNNKSPSSPSKRHEVFQFSYNSFDPLKDCETSQLKSMKNINTSPISSPITPPNKNYDPSSFYNTNFSNENRNKDSNIDDISSEFKKVSSNQTNTAIDKTKIQCSNINKNTIINKQSYFVSDDDDCLSPNMTNYDYYSKIIINMNMNCLNDSETNSLFSSLNEEKSIIDEKEVETIKNSKKGFRSKIRSISSITDEVFNNSLSASASNLNLEANIDKSLNLLQTKCSTSKLSRKNRNEEWSCNKLSIDNKNSETLQNSKFKEQKIKQLASSCSENTGSSLSVNGIRPKISSNVVNKIAKKFSNQNSSAIIDSVAGHSSTAIHSVSCLTTSIAKLNFH